MCSGNACVLEYILCTPHICVYPLIYINHSLMSTSAAAGSNAADVGSTAATAVRTVAVHESTATAAGSTTATPGSTAAAAVSTV